MAKIETQKARKDYKCSKCGKVISSGDTYKKIVFFRQKPIIRCVSCGFKHLR